MKTVKKQKLFKIIAYSLFILVVLSTALVTNIYAKYISKHNNETQSNVASFDIKVNLVDSNTLTQVVNYEMNPGSIIKLNVNLDGTKNDVKVNYIIKISTLDNLPLKTTYKGTDIKTSGIMGEINPHNSISINEIQIEWPKSIENSDYKYSGEIELITVSIEIEQVQ